MAILVIALWAIFLFFNIAFGPQMLFLLICPALATFLWLKPKVNKYVAARYQVSDRA